MDVATNLRTIQSNIKKACENSNRDSKEITIIGVTKYVTIERTAEAIEAGITNLGENRSEEFVEKYNHFQDAVNWHFIGTLQTRKVRDVVNKVHAIHSLDRVSLAKEIDKRAEKTVDCFIQVNISGESSKQGLHPDDVLPFIMEMEKYQSVRIIGLMTMAPHIDNEIQLRKIFKELAILRDTVKGKNLAHAPCEYLSMGMSNDYHIAIEEGATHIRIGSQLVGAY